MGNETAEIGKNEAGIDDALDGRARESCTRMQGGRCWNVKRASSYIDRERGGN